MRTLLVAILALTATPALPQPTCAPREAVTHMLETNHGERQQWRGLDANGMMVEVFANPETGTWTILVSGPEGASCLVAHGSDAGANWQAPGEAL